MEPKETIVAFFCGTGYDFPSNSERYISQREMGVGNDVVPKYPNNDQSFQYLESILSETQIGYGYDGCHRRRGGIFAYGIKQPSDHLFTILSQKFREETIQNREEVEFQKVTLVLIAHSRGCLSAFRLARKINMDSLLKEKVDIILELRDPVPGNLKIAASLDVLGRATTSGKFKDLSNCSNIKEVHITVYEKGCPNFRDVAYSVLIPKFHESTCLTIEYLPGLHDIQEQADSLIDTDGYYERHPSFFLLGVYKSLQIFSENNVKININNIFEYLSRLHGWFFNDLSEQLNDSNNQTPHDKKINQNKKLQIELAKETFDFVEGKDFSTTAFETYLKKVQIMIYNNLLEVYKENSKTHILTRSLHFGGTFRMLERADTCTHLNMRHAELMDGSNRSNLNIMLGFKGSRLDLISSANTFFHSNQSGTETHSCSVTDNACGNQQTSPDDDEIDVARQTLK